VFVLAQELLGMPQGTIRATVLIENILAAFEMDEILWELRDHSAGLNCGRWDYIFSAIRKFRNHPNFVLPDRAEVTMTSHMMRSYSLLTIKPATGAAFTPWAAWRPKFRSNMIPKPTKWRWPKCAPTRSGKPKMATTAPGWPIPAWWPWPKPNSTRYMPTPNQIHRLREDVHVTAEDLLAVPQGHITEDGLRLNIDVGIQYMAAWLNGNGCVPIYNLMEDAATAEISRSQVWQWLHNKAQLERRHGRNGRPHPPNPTDHRH
jgi:malate synthase